MSRMVLELIETFFPGADIAFIGVSQNLPAPKGVVECHNSTGTEENEALLVIIIVASLKMNS